MIRACNRTEGACADAAPDGNHGRPAHARVGTTDINCKTFLKIGFFVEWECHAKAKVC